MSIEIEVAKDWWEGLTLSEKADIRLKSNIGLRLKDLTDTKLLELYEKYEKYAEVGILGFDDDQVKVIEQAQENLKNRKK